MSKIIDLKNGGDETVVLNFQGTYEQFDKLLELFDSGKLSELLDVPVVNVEAFSLNTVREQIAEIRKRLEILFQWEDTDKVLVSSARSGRSRNIHQLSDKIQDFYIVEFDKAKLIKIGNREFVLIVNIKQEENQEMQIFFELISRGDIRSLPSGLELALISPSGKLLDSTTAKTGDNLISVPSKKPAKMGLEKLECDREQKKLYQVKITCDGQSYYQYFPSS